MLSLALQVALGDAEEDICVERGGSPAEPQFGRRNPEWLAPEPTPEVSLGMQQKYSQGIHQSWCPACGAWRQAPPASQEHEP